MTIAEIVSLNPNIQLVISASDLRKLVNEWVDKREAQKEAERKAIVSEQFITSMDAEKILGVTSATLWRWAKSGYLVPAKIGRKNIYIKSDIDKILSCKK